RVRLGDGDGAEAVGRVGGGGEEGVPDRQAVVLGCEAERAQPELPQPRLVRGGRAKQLERRRRVAAVDLVVEERRRGEQSGRLELVAEVHGGEFEVALGGLVEAGAAGEEQGREEGRS